MLCPTSAARGRGRRRGKLAATQRERAGWKPAVRKSTGKSACATKPLRAGEGGVGALGDGGEGSFDDAEAFVELLVGDDERDEDADDVVEGAGGDGDEAVLVAVARDLFGLGVGGLAWVSRLARIVSRAASRGSGVADQLDGAHAAEAANVADEIPFLLPAAGAFFKTLAEGGGAREQTLFLDGFDGGERGGAGDRVAAVCSAERAQAGRVHDFGAAGNGAAGRAAAERIPRGEQAVR